MSEQHESTNNPLYSKALLALQADEGHFGERPEAAHQVDVHNSICGDKYKFHFDYDQSLKDPAFSGYGCALSKASNALLMQHVEGRSWEELKLFCQQVLHYFSGQEEAFPDGDERFAVFLPVRKYPGRKKCVTLGWQQLADYADRNTGV